MTHADLALASALELAEGFRSRTTSPVEVLEAVLARIEAHEPALNAFVLVCAGQARDAARESEARWAKGEPRGPLDGVPVSVKDLNWMRGHPTRRGSRTLQDAAPDVVDTPAVERLREGGAVFVGKTTTPEFGWKGVTDSPLTGVTRNPWNRERTPGGSSGGAAASVASGMSTLALGGDGAGSIRIPAAFTGVFGLKPSAHTVPYYPPSPLGTLSQVGPLARTAADAALMLAVIARPDPRDPLARPPRASEQGASGRGPSGLRILYSDFGHAALESGVERCVARALETLEGLGARVDVVDVLFDDPRPWFEELFAAGQATLLRRIPHERHARLDPGFRALAESGLRVDLPRYLALQSARRELARRVARHLESHDLIVTPQLPLVAFEAGHDVPPGSGMTSWLDWNPYSYPFNLTGHPAASLPCGASGGLPVAIQVVAPPYTDASLLDVCLALEAALPGPGADGADAMRRGAQAPHRS